METNTEMNKQHRKKIGMQFKEKRVEAGWSVEQMATMADVKPVTVEKIEAGAFNVPLDILNRLAVVLGGELQIVINDLTE